MRLDWIEPSPDHPTLDVEYLAANGVLYEHLELDGAGYQTRLDALKAERGYIEQDVIALDSETEGLEAICAKFVDEHLHRDDEVRFVLAGEGVFDIRDDADRWMRLTVEAGDLLVVPKDRHHRFFLTERRHIRCVRLFQDAAGWVPQYR